MITISGIQRKNLFCEKQPLHKTQAQTTEVKTLPQAPLNVFFAGRPINTKLAAAQRAKKELERHLAQGTALSPKDRLWLRPLFKAIGSDATIEEINAKHSHPWSKQEFDHRHELLNTVNAIIGATSYRPTRKLLNGRTITAHNPIIAKRLSSSYTPESFKKLFDTAKQKGTFNLAFDTHGLPITTDIAHDEELVMRSNVWVTDTSRALGLAQEVAPERVKPALKKLSRFYTNETPEFKKICQNPALYGEGRDVNGVWQFHGVGHSFNPQTLQADRKFLSVRLDSQGVFLQQLTGAILSGFKQKTATGIASNKDIDKNMTDSIVMIALHLKAIKFPECTSCGNWENTKMHSITSDTEIVRAGLDGIRKIYKAKDPESAKLQRRLENTYVQLKQNWKLDYPEKSFRELIQGEISGANERLQMYSEIEYPHPDPKKAKMTDAALSFVPHTAVLSRKPLEDAQKNIGILDSLEKFVGDNGIIRYEDDAYENLNYELAIDSDAKFSFQDMKDRWTKTGPTQLQHKAEWFMVSDISKGYGVQLGKILGVLEREKRTATPKEAVLIDKTLRKQTEYINRAYGRITGEGTTKANGKDCPPWVLPESYMPVTNLNGGITYLPGTNTPLSWAKASLYDASMVMQSNIERLQKLNILPQA